MIRILSALFCFLFPITAIAQCQGDDIHSALSEETRADLQNRVNATQYGQGLYWRVEKDRQVMNILGTMHLHDPRHSALIDRVADQLDTADLVLVEATLQDQADMQIHMANNPDLVSINSGPTLPELLDEATWQTLRAAAQSRGVPGFLAAKMQPWFLAMSLSVPPCAMGALLAGEVGLDGLIMERAATLNIPVAPLEPWQDMLTLLSSGTQDEQLDALRASAIEPAIHDAIITALIDAYFDENMALGWNLSYALQDFVPNLTPAQYAEQLETLEQQLLVERNHNWIPVIETAAATHDNLFIAFGAAHLIGEDGILNLLENKGWTITAQ